MYILYLHLTYFSSPKGLLIGHNQTLTFKEQMEEELVSHRLPYLQG